MRHRIPLIALLLGAGLLWPFPLGAVVLMVAATFALVISWEEDLDRGAITRVPVRPHATTRSGPYGR